MKHVVRYPLTLLTVLILAVVLSLSACQLSTAGSAGEKALQSELDQVKKENESLRRAAGITGEKETASPDSQKSETLASKSESPAESPAKPGAEASSSEESPTFADYSKMDSEEILKRVYKRQFSSQAEFLAMLAALKPEDKAANPPLIDFARDSKGNEVRMAPPLGIDNLADQETYLIHILKNTGKIHADDDSTAYPAKNEGDKGEPTEQPQGSNGKTPQPLRFKGPEIIKLEKNYDPEKLCYILTFDPQKNESHVWGLPEEPGSELSSKLSEALETSLTKLVPNKDYSETLYFNSTIDFPGGDRWFFRVEDFAEDSRRSEISLKRVSYPDEKQEMRTEEEYSLKKEAPFVAWFREFLAKSEDYELIDYRVAASAEDKNKPLAIFADYSEETWARLVFDNSASFKTFILHGPVLLSLFNGKEFKNLDQAQNDCLEDLKFAIDWKDTKPFELKWEGCYGKLERGIYEVFLQTFDFMSSQKDVNPQVTHVLFIVH